MQRQCGPYFGKNHSCQIFPISPSRSVLYFLLILLCTPGSCLLWLVPSGLLWSLASIWVQPVGVNSRREMRGERGWALIPPAPLPGCGLAVAASVAPVGQPFPAGCSSRHVLHLFPSFAPSGQGVTASHSSSSLGTSSSLFPLSLPRPLHHLFITCSPITSVSVPSASCQDKKTKTLTGKSQEFWAQFRAVQFNSANIDGARSSESGSVPGTGDPESDPGTVWPCREFTA